MKKLQPHGGEAATIEYAIAALEIPDIIICGHSHCGAMNGLLHKEQIAPLPAVQQWLSHSETVLQNMEGKNSETAPDPLSLAVEENVLVQLENLRTHPLVADALQKDKLRIHGWVYRFENGQVTGFDSSQKKFVNIDQAETALK